MKKRRRPIILSMILLMMLAAAYMVFFGSKGRRTDQDKKETAQISMAWMLCKKPWIVPIPGTRKRERMEENMAAADVKLTIEDVKVLDDALNRMEMSEVFGGSKIVKAKDAK